jgi:N-acetylglucosaminyldiphosphoundecaprenol N-acetyl-beta-D-mannosaminyltransferase
MHKINLLDLSLKLYSKAEILEYIGKGYEEKGGMNHIVSINSENFVLATKQKRFNQAIAKAQMHIPDGVGVVAAIRLLYGLKISRLTGVDLMEAVVEYAYKHSLTCLLIGGKGKLAEELADCYKTRFKGIKIYSHQGILNKNRPKQEEYEQIKSIVTSIKPRFVFVSFGSPFQEIWIEENRAMFGAATVMGVGGAFSLLSGKVKRAPMWVRKLALEWLYRLLQQPWRIKRQFLHLPLFVLLVFKQYLTQLIKPKQVTIKL